PGSASQEDTGGVTAPSANAAAASANAAAPAALIFSSELKPLVFSGQIERRPNDRSIFRYLRFRLHDDTADTFFAGIFQVMAGQLLEIDAQGIRVRSYTTLVDELRSSAKSDKHQPYGPDAARRYYEMLTESVRDRLKSDYPVGTALSGGMDSTTLATLVCQLMEQDPDSTKAVGSKQQTFSAVFPNSINDEECYIDAFIRDHNSTVDAHKCQPQAAEFVDGLDDFIYTMEQPIISTGPYAQYQMLKMAAKNVRVFLTGAGPDEMMAGYVPYYFVYLRQLLHRHHYLRFLREALAASDKVFRLLRVRFASRLGGKKAWDEKSFISPQFAAGYTDEHYQAVQDNLKLRLVDDLFVISAPCVARYEDRSAMRFSLEGRLPFANKDLVRYIWSMSDDALIKGGWNKHMLRDAMLPYLPREVLNRRNKIGFSTPEVEWFGMLKDKFLEIFESESFAARPYFNVGTVRQAFRAFYDGKGDATTLAFWRLLHLELWLRRFIDAPLPPTPEEPPHPRGGHLKNTTRPLPPLDGVS
ncbi:MAG: asparagine synthase C-terminal domain-containing protein, partial [Actinomycetia bacterium]|nr:asparagine synthase C-terminal domain-containing protein [Actinomycetes bacterium]